MKVKRYTFLQAIETIVENVNIKQPTVYKKEIKEDKMQFVLPPKAYNSENAKRFLIGRGIDKKIIEECFNKNLFYESMPKHNLVFIGFDDNRDPKYAFIRRCVSTVKIF